MAGRARLVGAAREQALKNLSQWKLVTGRDAIARTFKFQDFKAAFGFMTQVATYADENEHHPEWCNTYNRVQVTLTTHDAGGLTPLDANMAAHMDEVAKQHKGN